MAPDLTDRALKPLPLRPALIRSASSMLRSFVSTVRALSVVSGAKTLPCTIPEFPDEPQK